MYLLRSYDTQSSPQAFLPDGPKLNLRRSSTSSIAEATYTGCSRRSSADYNHQVIVGRRERGTKPKTELYQELSPHHRRYLLIALQQLDCKHKRKHRHGHKHRRKHRYKHMHKHKHRLHKERYLRFDPLPLHRLLLSLIRIQSRESQWTGVLRPQELFHSIHYRRSWSAHQPHS